MLSASSLVPWFTQLALATVVWSASQNTPRSLTQLSEQDISGLISSPDPQKNLDPHDPDSHLFKILIPRAPDTANNTFVRQYLVSTLKSLNWDVEEDSFTDNTPYGTKQFTNVIATKDPDAPRRVILAAHFDSKFFPTYPQNQFLGATDSAAPCAILLDLAEALNPLLEQRQSRVKENKLSREEEEAADTTIQLVFFDGEEAFKDWTSTDSIYGARHLAARWSKEYVSSVGKRRLHPNATKITSIDHFVLLDLLGSAKPLIRSYFLSTSWLFDGLVQAEKRLGEMGAFNSGSSENKGDFTDWESFFIPRDLVDHRYGRIEDDHIPFLQRGVNILHVIASPFPRVWHTLQDDASALDIPTMKRWNLLFRVWTAEYLQLYPASYQNLVERTNDEL